MPLYTFRNKKTGEEWDDLMSISEMEKFTKKRNNRSYVSVVTE